MVRVDSKNSKKTLHESVTAVIWACPTGTKKAQYMTCTEVLEKAVMMADHNTVLFFYVLAVLIVLVTCASRAAAGSVEPVTMDWICLGVLH